MVIKISLLEKNKTRTKLLFKGLDETYINSLRRIMMNEVPVLAIEDVELKKNDSIIYDEIFCHRLGLIPLRTDIKSYELYKEGDPYNAKNSVKLKLKAKGPGYVYAEQLKSEDPKIVPVYQKMPLTKLLENQQVEFEATAITGQGIKHSKWSPGLFHFHQATKVNIKKQPDNKQETAKKFPKGLLAVKNGKLVVADEIKATEAEDYEDYDEAVEITPTDEFVFVMEPWGQLTLKEIVLQSMKTFNQQIDEFKEAVKNTK